MLLGCPYKVASYPRIQDLEKLLAFLPMLCKCKAEFSNQGVYLFKYAPGKRVMKFQVYTFINVLCHSFGSQSSRPAM